MNLFLMPLKTKPPFTFFGLSICGVVCKEHQYSLWSMRAGRKEMHRSQCQYLGGKYLLLAN